MGFFTKVFEKIALFSRVIYINKRSTLVAFIGLGISLALVTESLTFLYSYQFDAFNKYVKENPYEQITITPSNMIDTFNREDTIISDLEGFIDQSSILSNIESKINYRFWLNRRAVLLEYKDLIQNRTNLFTTTFAGISNDFFNIIQPYILAGGRLPANQGEVLLLLRPDKIATTNLTIGESNIYVIVNFLDLYMSIRLGIPDAGATFNVTGIVDVYAMQLALNNTIQEKTYINNLFSLIANDEMVLSFHKSLMLFTNNLAPYNFVAQHQSSFVGSILFDLNQINAFNLNIEITNLISFSDLMRTSIELSDFTNDVHIDLDLVEILQDFASEFAIFKIFLLLFMIPIITMALSLTAYSSNLIKKRRKKQLALLNLRGSSRSEIITMLFIELVIFTIISIIIAFILAYPYTFLILKSDGFMSFVGPTIVPQFYLIILNIIILTGFLGALFVNIGSIWNLSQLQQEEAFSEMSEKKPFWERYYIDVFFLIIGIVTWIITSIELRNNAVSFVFARILGAPAPLLVVFGVIMLTTRLFPKISNWFSKITWRIKRLELMSISLKSLSRRRATTMRSLVLVMFTFTMATLSIIIPDSYQQFDLENAYYDIGSDIVVSGISMSDTEYRNHIEAISGVAATSYVAWFNPTPVTKGSLTYTYKIMGINTTEFSNVIYFEDEYLDSTLEEMLPLLETSLGANISANVFINKEEIKPFNVEPGENLDIYIPYWISGYEIIRNHTIHLLDLYNYWPVVYHEEPVKGSSNFKLSIITSIDNIYNIINDYSDLYVQLFIKVADGYPRNLVIKEVESWSYGKHVESINEIVTISEGSLRATVLYGSLNSNFIASIIILIFAMALMMIIQTTERISDVGLMKAAGISPSQLFGFFYTESFTILMLGAFIGTLLGIFTSYMFMSIIAINTFIPPWEMGYSIVKLLLTLFTMFGVSLLSSALPGFIFARKKEANIIKEI